MSRSERGIALGRCGYGPETVSWDDDGVVAHELAEFDELEEIEYEGQMVRAFADRPVSIAAMFERACTQAPDREFVVFPEYDTRLTYGEIDSRVEQLVAGLAASGLEPGDRLAIVCSNQPAFVELVVACARLGVVCAPLNIRSTAEKLGYMLTDFDPDLVVTDEAYVDTLERSAYDGPAAQTYVVGDRDGYPAYEELFLEGTVETPEIRETDPFVVCYTSGTTGKPKGVPADNFHCVNAALNNAFSFGLSADTTICSPTPLFHVTAFVCGLFAGAAVGGTVVFLDDFSPSLFVETIDTERVEYCMGVPTNIVLAAETVDVEAYDVSSLERFAYGGAPMPTDAIPRIREVFPDVELCESYGKTENLAGIAAMKPGAYVESRASAVGVPSPITRFAVVDEDGNRLGPGEVGELVISGGLVVNRYLNRPEETAAAFADGWHYTGDIGVIDEDGFIELKGRKGDMIIRGGENIYPIEIEEVLVSHEDVLEASVADFPDDVLGERVLAAVVPKEGAHLTEDDLRAVCREHLPVYKTPDLFRILSALPRNASGKIERQKIVPEPLQFGIKAGE